MIQIINPVDSKTRNAKDLEIIFYEQTSLEGNTETVKGVQFTIIGNNREWVDWIPYNEFIANNPNVTI